MSTKKSTKEQKERAELAAHLAAVLAHPATPVDLYNVISENITDMSNSLDSETPSYIADVLAAFEADERHRNNKESETR